MQIGLVSSSFRGSLGCGLVETAWLIRRAAASGLTSLAITPPVDAKGGCIRLGNLAESEGVRLEILAGSLERENVAPVVERALRLGAKTIRTRLGWHYPYRQPGQQGAHLERATRRIEKVLPTLESAGLTLTIENYGEATAEELAEFVRILNHPDVGVCLDVVNNIALFEDPEHTAQTLAPFTRTVHLRDATFSTGSAVTAQPCALGEGDLNLSKIVETIVRYAPSDKIPFQIETPVGSIHTGPRVFELENAAFECSVDFCAAVLGFSLPTSAASRRRAA